MHRIIRESIQIVSKSSAPVIPYLLVQYWNDLKTIPSDVKKCIDSWNSLKKWGFKHFLFDDESAKEFVEENFDTRHLKAFTNCNHPAMRSDYFRLCFILINGGFYADADDVYRDRDVSLYFYNGKLKLQPLCYSLLTNSMAKISDSISTPYNSSEFIFYVNNNPIISPPNHPIIHMALERATQILLDQNAESKQDVQSETGPGNLTISLIQHFIETNRSSISPDFEFIPSWDEIAVSQWPLEYRFDKRNWRLWDGLEKEIDKRKGDIK